MESFAKRFRLYAIGLVIGIGASYLFLGDRLANKGWLPSERIKDRLTMTLVKATEEANTTLRSRGVSMHQLRTSIKTGTATLSDPNHHDDSLFYKVECRVNDQPLEMLVLLHRDFSKDSTATVWEVK